MDTVYNRHRRWSADGTYEKVLAALRCGADSGEGREWTVSVDAGVVRAHQHAAGARHQPPTDVAGDVVATLALDTGGGRITRNPAVGRTGRRSAGPATD